MKKKILVTALATIMVMSMVACGSEKMTGEAPVDMAVEVTEAPEATVEPTEAPTAIPEVTEAPAVEETAAPAVTETPGKEDDIEIEIMATATPAPEVKVTEAPKAPGKVYGYDSKGVPTIDLEVCKEMPLDELHKTIQKYSDIVDEYLMELCEYDSEMDIYREYLYSVMMEDVQYIELSRENKKFFDCLSVSVYRQYYGIELKADMDYLMEVCKGDPDAETKVPQLWAAAELGFESVLEYDCYVARWGLLDVDYVEAYMKLKAEGIIVWDKYLD